MNDTNDGYIEVVNRCLQNVSHYINSGPVNNESITMALSEIHTAIECILLYLQEQSKLK